MVIPIEFHRSKARVPLFESRVWAGSVFGCGHFGTSKACSATLARRLGDRLPIAVPPFRWRNASAVCRQKLLPKSGDFQASRVARNGNGELPLLPRLLCRDDVCRTCRYVRRVSH